MRRVRGAGIGFIFQEPMAALSPVFSVGDQIAEAIVVHGQAGWPEARRRAVGLLEAVRVPDAASRASDYPHQLSGGLRQRAMIAVALACRPPLIIADEPTTALDVTIQAEILELLRDLRDRYGLALLLITHDLGVVAQTADTMAVMYAGRIVEHGPTLDVLSEPRHPYTQGLLASMPGGAASSGQRLADDRRAGAHARAVAARLRVRAALPAQIRSVPPRGTGPVERHRHPAVAQVVRCHLYEECRP